MDELILGILIGTVASAVVGALFYTLYLTWRKNMSAKSEILDAVSAQNQALGSVQTAIEQQGDRIAALVDLLQQGGFSEADKVEVLAAINANPNLQKLTDFKGRLEGIKQA